MQIPVLGLRVLQRDHTEKTSLANHGRPVLLIIGETSAHVWISSKRCANKYNNSLKTCNMYSMKCGKPNHKPRICGWFIHVYPLKNGDFGDGLTDPGSTSRHHPRVTQLKPARAALRPNRPDDQIQGVLTHQKSEKWTIVVGDTCVYIYVYIYICIYIYILYI